MNLYGYEFERESDIYHHGIKGQRWGVRRYRNEDGSLTDAGRKRYLQNGERAYKDLKKQVHKQRGANYGASNRWMSTLAIGPNSDKVLKVADKKRKEYSNSEEYKKWKRAYDEFEKKAEKLLDSGKMSIKDYDKQHKELFDKRPKKEI